MTQDEVLAALHKVVAENMNYTTWTVSTPHLVALVNLAIEKESDRIKQANAPEIERVNAHIKELEDAILAEREACAEICEARARDDRVSNHRRVDAALLAERIRARGQA
jgi:hypothetical protein